jgi:hypothetical protein
MAFLGALEHGVYVEKEDDDECHGMSTAQIYRHFGLDKDSSDEENGSDDEMSVVEEEQYQTENIGDEESMSDDDDWMACPSGSEDEEMEELDGPDVVCFIIISWVHVSQTILGPFRGAV